MNIFGLLHVSQWIFWPTVIIAVWVVIYLMVEKRYHVTEKKMAKKWSLLFVAPPLLIIGLAILFWIIVWEVPSDFVIESWKSVTSWRAARARRRLSGRSPSDGAHSA